MPLSAATVLLAQQGSLTEEQAQAVLWAGLLGSALVLYLAVVVWLAGDVRRRGESVPLWLILLHVAGPLALLAWLCVRPRLVKSAPPRNPTR